MSAYTGAELRRPIEPVIIALALIALTIAVLLHTAIEEAALAVAALTLLVVGHRKLLTWRSLLAFLVVVIYFIPIKRYSLPASLPFELEPYRLLVGLLLAMWVACLLVDPGIRLARTVFDAPLALVAAAILGSELANPSRVNELGTYVSKDLLFFSSFLLVVYLVASVARTRDDVEFILKAIVGGGAVVAVTLLFERRFLYNIFDHLQGVVPFLSQQISVQPYYEVEFRQQVIGSAQHPIAMGAAMALLVPCALYLAINRSRLWWFAAIAIALGTMATAARTAVVMIVVAGVVLLILRWSDLRRFLPALLPFAILTWVAAPGAIGTIRTSFFPPGGIIAEQSTVVPGNEALANNRLADIGPSMVELSHQPLLGQGWGTRITGFYEPFVNAAILDDQWLLLLLESGVIGFAAFIWLFVRVLKRLSRTARSRSDSEGWLAAALAASIASFGIGMLTFDAFSFIQVSFLFFLLLALASALLRLRTEDPLSPVPDSDRVEMFREPTPSAFVARRAPQMD
jgi:polysaccharide biosynthesis protein PslJ